MIAYPIAIPYTPRSLFTFGLSLALFVVARN